MTTANDIFSFCRSEIDRLDKPFNTPEEKGMVSAYRNVLCVIEKGANFSYSKTSGFTSTSKVYNINQVAERFNVKPRTVRSWISLGIIPCSKFGKFIRFSEEQLDSFARHNSRNEEVSYV